MKKTLILDYLILAIVAVAVMAMLYGYIKYPAAPIRPVDDKFLDKQKKEYTAEEFRAFKTWEMTLFICIACGIPLGITKAVIDEWLKKENK
ncbi:MAG TPA: hypothetical protein VF721_22610 [Pyrinomonadaceae bacterium]|jgi:hypothetical protein